MQLKFNKLTTHPESDFAKSAQITYFGILANIFLGFLVILNLAVTFKLKLFIEWIRLRVFFKQKNQEKVFYKVTF